MRARHLPGILFLLALSSPARADLGWFVDVGFKPVTVELRSLYSEAPAFNRCLQGRLAPEETKKALDAVNAIRSLHGLKPVRYEGRGDALAEKAALIIAASGEMTHHPEKELECWSSTGRSGSEQSNLYMGTFSGSQVPSTEYLVAGWVKDVGVEGLGHRRWILDPTLRSISFGRVDHAGAHRYGAAMLVSDLDPNASLEGLDFVAWPQGRYPAFVWHPKAEWSVSIADLPRAGETQGFDFFPDARVEVSDEETGRRVDVSRLRRDRHGYGLPNLLSWRVAGVQTDRWYAVRISGVTMRDGSRRELKWRVYIDARPPSRTVRHGGVEWEQKTAAKSRDKFSFSDAKRYCSTLGGRMPSLRELEKVVAKGRKFAVNQAIFPNISPYANYWTETEWQPGSGLQQVIAFWQGGAVYQQQRHVEAGVLCVVGK